MTDNEIRQQLEAERQRLTSVKDALVERDVTDEEQQESVSELSSYDQHPADQGSETFERTKTLSTVEQVDNELEEVDIALRRLEDGSYGTCERCGREIDADRLRARPASRYCVEHQAEVEREARGS